MTANTPESCVRSGAWNCAGTATVTDRWTGEPYCPHCAAVQSINDGPLSRDTLASELRNLITPEHRSNVYNGQNDAIDNLAALILFQQQRIAALEVVVAKLTKE